MRNVWQFQEAKNKFSGLVDKARHDGPQIVTKYGKETVVVIAVEDYRKLSKPTSDLISVFRKSPLFGINLDLTRGKSVSRDTT
jgi:antitoxin Phd